MTHETVGFGEPETRIRFGGTHSEIVEDFSKFGFGEIDVIAFPFGTEPQDQATRADSYELFEALRQEFGRGNILLCGARPKTELANPRYSAAEHAIVFGRPTSAS